MKIFVKNLSEKVKPEELRKAAGEFGKVLGVSLIKDAETGKPTGAYIEMASREETEAALKGLKGLVLNEQEISVQMAAPQNEQTRQSEASFRSGGPVKARSGFKGTIRMGGANRGR